MPVVKGNNKSAKLVKSPAVSGPRYDKVLMEAGEYEVTKDSTFVIKLPMSRQGKWWVLVREEDAEIVHEVICRMWTYDEMIEMRKLSTKYDGIRRVHTIDYDILNRLKIQRLIKSWSFANENPRLALHHVNGVLCDESWQAIRRLQTNLLQFIIGSMNDHYEGG